MIERVDCPAKCQYQSPVPSSAQQPALHIPFLRTDGQAGQAALPGCKLPPDVPAAQYSSHVQDSLSFGSISGTGPTGGIAAQQTSVSCRSLMDSQGVRNIQSIDTANAQMLLSVEHNAQRGLLQFDFVKVKAATDVHCDHLCSSVSVRSDRPLMSCNSAASTSCSACTAIDGLRSKHQLHATYKWQQKEIYA
jgi:hypothetical protein